MLEVSLMFPTTLEHLECYKAKCVYCSRGIYIFTQLMSIQSSIKREESIDAAKTIIAPYKKADEKLRALMTSTIDSYKQYIYPELFDIIKASVLFT